MMAKLELLFTPYQRRDPVTDEVGSYLRKATARQTSRRLKEFQQCVADQMRGKTFRGPDPAANARAVREAFASAAKQCERG